MVHSAIVGTMQNCVKALHSLFGF